MTSSRRINLGFAISDLDLIEIEVTHMLSKKLKMR